MLRDDPISVVWRLSLDRLILVIKYIRYDPVKRILFLNFNVINLKVNMSWKINVTVLDQSQKTVFDVFVFVYHLLKRSGALSVNVEIEFFATFGGV